MSFTSLQMFYDDVNVDQEWESLARTVTQTDIVNFAGVSGDHNPIHMDHEFAKTTPFRQVVAQGLLVLGMASGLGMMAPPMRTLAFIGIQDWRFKEPVFIGDTIRVRSKVLKKEERSRGRRGIITWQRQIFNQENKIVQEGITVTMVEGRANLKVSKNQQAAANGPTEPAAPADAGKPPSAPTS